MHFIRIRVIVLTDDGVAASRGPTHHDVAGLTWGQYMAKLVGDANAIYEDQGIGFRLAFDEATDVSFKQSTLLNTLQPSPMKKDANDNDDNPNGHARQREAWKYPGQAVVIWRDFDKSTETDFSAHSTGAHGDYIYLNKANSDRGVTLAHELGHFFHLEHTHDKNNGVETIADAAAKIREFVEAPGLTLAEKQARKPIGDSVFDNDLPGVTDTPPDPGPTLWKNVSSASANGHCDAALTKIDVTVDFASDALGKKQYTLAPDRRNFMSYFTHCESLGKPKISPVQRSVMETALQTGNRNGLLHTAAMNDDHKAWFFKGKRTIRYDISQDAADDGYPKSIADDWPGLPWAHVGAAAIWPDGRIFFFHDDEYVKYDRANRRVFPDYPKKIVDAWHGIWTRGLDAVLVGSDHAWFFKGNQCIKFDIAADKGEGVAHARTISDKFPGVWGTGIDAALRWPGGKVYFIKGDRFARFDVSSQQTDQDTRWLRGNWPGLWSKGVGAAVVWNDGAIRFVRDGEFISYSCLGDEPLDGYPKPLTRLGWKDFPWTTGFDAGAVWNNGKAYIFKGSQYLRIDLDSNAVDEKPRDIGPHWQGLGNEPIDALVRWNNGKAYAFRGDHYLQIDVASKTVISGKLDIATFWKGIPSQRYDAVIALWDYGKAYFFKDGHYWRYDIAADRKDDGYPSDIAAGRWWGLNWS